MALKYVPGVCNIGPAEIRRRRSIGVVGSVVTASAITASVALGVPKPVRMLVALPAAAGAVGFLQAGLHFCARFGMAGLFNVSDGVGAEEEVWQTEYREADRRKALTILGGSAGIGVGVAALAVLLP